MHNLNVENYVLFGRFSEDLRQEASLSDPSGGLLRRGRRSQDIEEFLQQKPGSGNIKDHCSLKKTRHLKLRNLVLFYVWEDSRVWLIEIIPLICTLTI